CLNGTTGAAKADRSAVAAAFRLTSKDAAPLLVRKSSMVMAILPACSLDASASKREPIVIQQNDISWFRFVATAWLSSVIAMQQRGPDFLRVFGQIAASVRERSWRERPFRFMSRAARQRARALKRVEPCWPVVQRRVPALALFEETCRSDPLDTVSTRCSNRNNFPRRSRPLRAPRSRAPCPPKFLIVTSAPESSSTLATSA